MNYSNNTDMDEKQKGTGKGFYVALAVCLVAIVGVAIVSFWDREPMVDDPPLTTTQVQTPTVTTTARPVGATATGIPDTRTTTTTVKITTTAKPKPLFVLPASNVILETYSDMPVYSETLGEWRTHDGVDFLCDSGENVKAVADGTISAVKEDALWGQVIEIDHGDKLISRYCGVKPFNVKAGQAVKAGAVIGTMGDIPMEIAKPSHLHLEMVSNGKTFDPMTLIQGETVKYTTTPTETE